MKVFAIGGILVAGMFVAISLSYENSTEFIEVTNEVEVMPEWADNEEAVKAAQDVIRRQELEEELAELKQEVEERNSRINEIEKELGTYWTVSRIKALIRSTWPEDAQTALAVAQCESGFKQSAYNDKNVTPTYDSGIFQINSIHQKRLDELGLDKWNVEDNIRFARMLYDESGWQPWVCFTKRMHLAHL